jgi:hypothetical protein
MRVDERNLLSRWPVQGGLALGLSDSGEFGYPSACFLTFGHTSPPTYAEGTGV